MASNATEYKIVVPAEMSGNMNPNKRGCKEYNWCGFCGSVGNIYQVEFASSFTSFYSFCDGTKCQSKYEAHANSSYRRCQDLTYGIPFLCIMKKNDNGDLVVPVSEDKQEDLKCANCGKCDSNVIINTCMDKDGYKYMHNTFCRNNKCCAEYKLFINNRRSEHIPDAYTSECMCCK
jgi:hypothetical protein